MSRLYDRVVEEIDRGRLLVTGTKLATAISEAVVIDASNVADYYMRNNPQEEWEMLKDFPNIAPPWPSAFYEWRIPEQCNSEGKVFRPTNAGSRYAVYLHSEEGIAERVKCMTDMDDSQLFQAWCIWMSWLRNRGQLDKDMDECWRKDPRTAWANLTPSIKAQLKERIIASRPQDLPWAWVCEAYVFCEEDRIRLFPICMNYPVLADGRAVEGEPGVGEIILSMLSPLTPEQQDHALGAVTFMHVPWLAISFMHCKNVTLTANDPPEKLNRARIKRGKKPLIRYYTLDIEPMKEVLRREGQIEKTGLKKALHICRGHFAQYGDAYGKGRLFGKYEGQFWMPMHVRGSAKEGVVVKDYRVKAPMPEGGE